MKRKLVTRPLLILAGLAALSAAAFLGCGSDVSSRPDLGTSGYDVPPPEPPQIADNEISLPEPPRDKFAFPSNFEARAMQDCVRLTWSWPSVGYTAILQCDGMEIAAVDARTFQFDDRCVRAPGIYRYSLRFAKGNTVGTQVHQIVAIVPEPVRKDLTGNSLEDK